MALGNKQTHWSKWPKHELNLVTAILPHKGVLFGGRDIFRYFFPFFEHITNRFTIYYGGIIYQIGGGGRRYGPFLVWVCKCTKICKKIFPLEKVFRIWFWREFELVDFVGRFREYQNANKLWKFQFCAILEFVLKALNDAAKRLQKPVRILLFHN